MKATHAVRDANRHRSHDLIKDINSIKRASARFKARSDRFAIYDVLRELYRIYFDWKHQKAAKQRAHLLGKDFAITERKGASPIRVLVEAALPDAHLKQKSRWVRALQYVYSANASPLRFRKFVRAKGGLASCARLAASTNRKRARPGGDWNDDD